MKKIFAFGPAFLFSMLMFGQSDQELTIASVMNATTISEVKALDEKNVFKEQYSDQLRYDIVQTTWQLVKRKKEEQIGLLTLSQGDHILYTEVYRWDFNEDWDFEDLTAIWNYTTLDSKTTNEIDSLVDFEHLSKLPNQFMFGYGCWAVSAMPREGEVMLALVDKNDVEELYAWLQSINPVLQAYGYLGFKMLESKGTVLDTPTKDLMKVVKDMSIPINFCSGCTTWEYRPVNEIITNQNIRNFLSWYK